MVIIKQYFRHSCVLACIQSFLADNFKTITQSQMIYEFPDICKKDTNTEGTIDTNDIEKLCHKLNILCEKLNEIIPANYPKETIIIIYSKKDDHHCVRFHTFINENELYIMNPLYSNAREKYEFQKITIKELNEHKPIYVKLIYIKK